MIKSIIDSLQSHGAAQGFDDPMTTTMRTESLKLKFYEDQEAFKRRIEKESLREYGIKKLRHKPTNITPKKVKRKKK